MDEDRISYKSDIPAYHYQTVQEYRDTVLYIQFHAGTKLYAILSAHGVDFTPQSKFKNPKPISISV